MLTPTQLTRINKHLRSDNWLLNNDLIAELTDHYVDAITDKLADNVPFEVALQDVQRSFGGRKGLLAMEENYQKTYARSNFRVYKEAFKKACQWPGIGYTLLVWAGCYGLVRTLPFAWIADQIDTMSMAIFMGLLLAVTGLFVSAFILMYRLLQSGTFSMQPAHAPTYMMVQSTVVLAYLSVILPVRQLAENQPALCALVMTLVGIHEWAGMCMLAFVYRKRLA